VARLALLTFVVLREPWGSPLVAGFEERLDPVAAAARRADGFIDADDEDDDPSLAQGDGRPRPWGAFVLPASYQAAVVASNGPRAASFLSIWRDVDAAFTFTYSGSHLEAIGHRSEWMATRRWPSHVAWWIGDDDYPSWADGASRIDRLMTDGPSAAAFDFHRPFDPDGRPTPRPTLRRDRSARPAGADAHPRRGAQPDRGVSADLDLDGRG
jgi:Domain of unknown function (DUF3291)